MDSTPEQIATLWRRQMQKGYLKLAVLFALIRGQLHGYELMKRVDELSLGMLKPTAGSIYPTLRELERAGLIKGEWKPEERKKVYTITARGREVLTRAAEKHLNFVSAVRKWILKDLIDLKILDTVEPLSLSPSLMEVVRVLLLEKSSSPKEKVKALKRLRDGFQSMISILDRAMHRIDELVEKLELEKA